MEKLSKDDKLLRLRLNFRFEAKKHEESLDIAVAEVQNLGRGAGIRSFPS